MSPPVFAFLISTFSPVIVPVFVIVVIVPESVFLIAADSVSSLVFVIVPELFIITTDP